MIAVRSSKSRGKESTDSGRHLNSLQLNSEIVGTSQVDCDLGNQKKKKKRSDFLEESPTIPNKNPKLLFNKSTVAMLSIHAVRREVLLLWSFFGMMVIIW